MISTVKKVTEYQLWKSHAQEANKECSLSAHAQKRAPLWSLETAIWKRQFPWWRRLYPPSNSETWTLPFQKKMVQFSSFTQQVDSNIGLYPTNRTKKGNFKIIVQLQSTHLKVTRSDINWNCSLYIISPIPQIIQPCAEILVNLLNLTHQKSM